MYITVEHHCMSAHRAACAVSTSAGITRCLGYGMHSHHQACSASSLISKQQGRRFRLDRPGHAGCTRDLSSSAGPERRPGMKRASVAMCFRRRVCATCGFATPAAVGLCCAATNARSEVSQHTWRLLLEALWALERQLRSWAMGLAAPEALTGGDTPRNVCLGVLLSRDCTGRQKEVAAAMHARQSRGGITGALLLAPGPA